MSADLAGLVEAADLNRLLRAVDSLCAARDWERLIDLAEMCEDALERGKQLWPIAAHIDYRLALEGPPEYAASVLDPEVGRFALGPLTEVAASTHTWSELEPHLDDPRTAAYVAQERVLRGEDLTRASGTHAEVLQLPLRLYEWEPTYALATYRSDHVEVAEAWDPKAPLAEVEPAPAGPLEEPELESALLELVAPWTMESNGAARAVVVEGDAAGAAAMLAFQTLRLGRLQPDEAIQRLAWASASGGAYGKRRGAAFGRFLAWHTVAVFGELAWPVAPEEVGRTLQELDWYRWDEGEPERGWVLRIAVQDRALGWSAAIGATDVTTEDEEP